MLILHALVLFIAAVAAIPAAQITPAPFAQGVEGRGLLSNIYNNVNSLVNGVLGITSSTTTSTKRSSTSSTKTSSTKIATNTDFVVTKDAVSTISSTSTASLSTALRSSVTTTRSIATSAATPSATGSVCSGNTADDRSVWCDYSIDTDWYSEAPDTGVTVEYWLDVTNVTLAPDGVERLVLAVNGTVPGPTIEANWGDTVRIHVRNSLTNNGTGIHWHGIRQNYTFQEDGVPSITQCPIAPGDSLTYTWKATQYGTSWYHSHYSLQAWEGVFGPIVIHGPATADYDEELDTIMLTDWGHETVDSQYTYAQVVGPPLMDTALINGMNVWEGAGSRYEANFENGKKYRLRLINSAIDTYFKFSIDNHTMTVIANDFVPIVPFETDVLTITMGQRYDIIVEANDGVAGVGDYWMRAIPQLACSNNNNPDDVRAIIRYDSSSTATPSTSAWNQTDACEDVPLASLVPHLSQSVSDPTGENLDVAVSTNEDSLFRWQIGPTSMQVQWGEPSIVKIWEGNATFENDECVYQLPDANKWMYWVIETDIPVPHPIHLHGHDFFILASAESASYDSSVTLNLDNPPRRDVASLPASGYLVISFLTDNPGAWLMHCHIGWHTSEGLALQFVERESEVPALVDYQAANATCAKWDEWANTIGIEEEDSGV
ncbi:laccase-1 [Lophiotrema nucula]|uniref:laccase n=1 Tax=Lophiotrema nucula TaxID=690887 RepID=A0A6A5ZA51_9PLEO|nr:laccase-1 [Lophiotrema nucula]